MKGRNDPTIFLPLSPKLSGQMNNNRPKDSQYLTEEQARYIYKKIEWGDIINVDTLCQEIEKERELNRIGDTCRDKHIKRIDS